MKLKALFILSVAFFWSGQSSFARTAEQESIDKGLHYI